MENAEQLPPAVVEKLVEAKDWYDNEPTAATGTRAGLEREDWERQGLVLLEEIVEAIDSTIGFGRRTGE